MTEVRQWHHVPSKQNHVDLISRGADPVKLQLCELWWSDPLFLLQPVMTKCQDDIPEESEELYLRELKPPAVSEICALINTYEPLDVINNWSSYNKLLRVVAWCKRFLHNTRHPLHATRGTLTTSELSSALLCIVKNVQMTSFVTEIQCLEKGSPIPYISKLLNLCPFLDHEGVLRVGGRLKNSAETTLSLTRSKFWIVSARNLIRKIIFNCMICKKVNSRSVQQQMADLPAARVTISRVFAKTGLDFCSPFLALHFEIVNGLTSAAFIAALKRFIARRGKPSDIFSDNGRNFVGVHRELRAILKSLFRDKSEEEIEGYLANEGINWPFNPSSTPHFGGLWEASVKSLKYHLKRVVGKTILTYEEFFTLIVQIESVLNSRPLCPISNDPNDVEALTPAHFLIGSSLIALPKWYKGKVEMKQGDLVLVKDSDNYSPLKWHLARIIKTHPGQDNIIRVVTLKDKNGIYKRPMTKIVPFPFVNEKVSVT
ncbi:uncharacterized protein LOC118201458 [Stegodyphus dumicola]|uniref:uncharacterized protein LOC118201458 n=1 Tax=Stegodyphus dumicola TaxID=202533 RepID=UPI0015AFE050|nr:uncharacterized protein LOC118201458 [Stegodyphus dumicola]